jgi:hypothetical protein
MRSLAPALVVLSLGRAEADRKVRPFMSTDLERGVVTELAHLADQAKREEAASPDHPVPARQLAYHLLAGLAIDGEDASAVAKTASLACPRTGECKFVHVGTAVVELGEYTIQDKSGSWRSLYARYYQQVHGHWVVAGIGEAVAR